MVRRGKIEIIRDILKIIQENHNSVKFTPLLRKTNVSSSRFREYYNELLEKGFIQEITDRRGNKFISLTEKGTRFLEKYAAIINFISEFEL